MSQPSRWRVEPRETRLTLNGVELAIDPRRPASGLRVLTSGNSYHEGTQILGVALPGDRATSAVALVDAYAQETDFVAIYAREQPDNLRIKIVWRSTAPTEAGSPAAVDLLVGVQTSLLHSEPTMGTRTLLPTGECLRLVDVERGEFAALEWGRNRSACDFGPQELRCFVLRGPDPSRSYVELIHPSDNCGTELTTVGEDACQLSWHLFPQSLEKGVIRRARIRGAWLPRAGDLEQTARIYTEFAAADPVLD